MSGRGYYGVIGEPLLGGAGRRALQWGRRPYGPFRLSPYLDAVLSALSHVRRAVRAIRCAAMLEQAAPRAGRER